MVEAVSVAVLVGCERERTESRENLMKAPHGVRPPGRTFAAGFKLRETALVVPGVYDVSAFGAFDSVTVGVHFQQVGVFVEAPPVAGLLFVELVRRLGLKQVGEVVYLVFRIEMDVNDQFLLLGLDRS